MSVTHSINPIVKRRRVPVSPDRAFTLFTDELGSWWPLATHSVGGDQAVAAVFEAVPGGRIYERTADGAEHQWGEVLEVEPGRRLVFTWHPGRAASTAQTVEVTFTESDGECLVELVHRGWEALGETAAQTRAGYDSGWDHVFDECFGSYAEAAP
jgi:uncharacterized protein YndB with AHSA1/START domain